MLEGKILLAPATNPKFCNDFPLVDGAATVGYLDLDLDVEYRLRAVMVDGEIIDKRVKVSLDQGTVRFERGTGIAPVTISLDVSSDARLVLETPTGQLATGAAIADASLLTGAFAFELGAGKVRLIGASTWRTLWVLLADGRIGRADNPGPGPEARGRWLTARRLPELDLARAFDARKPTYASVYFEVQLTTAEGASSWQIVDTVHLNPKKRSLGWPRWTKHSVGGVPHRFRMRLPDGRDELLVPTRR